MRRLDAAVSKLEPAKESRTHKLTRAGLFLGEMLRGDGLKTTSEWKEVLHTMSPQAALLLRIATVNTTRRWFQNADRGGILLLIFCQCVPCGFDDDVVFQGVEEYCPGMSASAAARELGRLWEGIESTHPLKLLPTLFKVFLRQFRNAEIRESGRKLDDTDIAYAGSSRSEVVSARIEELEPGLGSCYKADPLESRAMEMMNNRSVPELLVELKRSDMDAMLATGF